MYNAVVQCTTASGKSEENRGFKRTSDFPTLRSLTLKVATTWALKKSSFTAHTKEKEL